MQEEGALEEVKTKLKNTPNPSLPLGVHLPCEHPRVFLLGPCGPCAELSEEAAYAGVLSYHLTCSASSFPVLHCCSPVCSICPLTSQGVVLDLSWRSCTGSSLCLQELSPTAGLSTLWHKPFGRGTAKLFEAEGKSGYECSESSFN